MGVKEGDFKKKRPEDGAFGALDFN